MGGTDVIVASRSPRGGCVFNTTAQGWGGLYRQGLAHERGCAPDTKFVSHPRDRQRLRGHVAYDSQCGCSTKHLKEYHSPVPLVRPSSNTTSSPTGSQ